MHILLIEDDAEMAARVVQGLEADGHVVAHADTGSVGMRRARTENFEVLVIDCLLPDTDGFSLVAALRTGGHAGGSGDRKKCERRHLPLVACGRARPKLVVVLCASRIYDEVFTRLGRAALLVSFDTGRLPSDEEVLGRLEQFEPVAQGVINEVSNRAKSLYAPLIPLMNFQNPAGSPIAREVQRAPESFSKIMQDYHEKLYDGAFRNPKKKRLWGAYMFDKDTAFQQDHLHTNVQIIGEQSRADGFHLLNAYHVYGVPTDPGFHFDVMNLEGKAINHVFEDILTGNKSEAGESHVNITPCDRRL